MIGFLISGNLKLEPWVGEEIDYVKEGYERTNQSESHPCGY